MHRHVVTLTCMGCTQRRRHTHTSAQAGCDLSEGMLLVELYFLNHKGNFPPHAAITLIKHLVTQRDMKTDTKKRERGKRKCVVT